MWTAGARASVVCALLVAVTRFASPAQTQRLLVLHSFGPDSATPAPFDTITIPVLERSLGSRVEVLNEYLELHRFPGEHHAQELSASLRSRYAGQDISGIVPIAFPALEFFLQYLEDAFPKTPVVFVAVETHRIQGLDLPKNITGVVHIDDWGSALREILRMQSDTQEVVVVAGSAATDQTYLEMQKKLFEPYKSRVRFRYVTNLPLLDILAIVSQLPPHTIVLQSAFAWDSRGQALTDNGALKLIYKASNVPVYALVGRNLGNGLVGGPMPALQERYLLAAHLLSRILRGESPRAIPVQTAHPVHAMAFDSRQLSRWHISESNLPSGSLIAFREPSNWDKYKSVIAGAIALCLLETLLLAAMFVQRSRRRSAEQALLKSRNEVRDLAGKWIVAQEEERRRIACELHDEVSQQLATVGILASSAMRGLNGSAPSVSGQLTQLQKCLKSVQVGIRELSYRLHPSVLERLGLSAALRRHVEEFSRRSAITIDFEDRIDSSAMPPDVALCLYRVAQEALRNLERHSGVQEARLDLDVYSNAFELTVSDEGRGFDPAQVRQMAGLGLTSMRERMILVGGEFHVESAPGRGTIVRARAPFQSRN